MTVAAPEFSVAFGAARPASGGVSVRRAGAERSASLVLTRRGRFVVALVVAFGIAFGAMAFGSSVAANQTTAGQLATTTVVVQPGDTLWGIAAAADSSRDIRAIIDDIVHLNGLESGSKLPVGAVLTVPAAR